MPTVYSTSAYRYPNERLILLLTLLLVFAVIVVTATATLCGSLIFVIGIIALSYQMTRNLHRQLLQSAFQVSTESSPGLEAVVDVCRKRLQPGSVQVFVTRSKALNAYTFGLAEPKVLVLYSSLLNLMDEDELRFVIGHEMGHVRLGHTWLNSLVGGLAGIPSSFAAATLLVLTLRGWNRACEYSADRAGLLACGKPEKAISALVKLVAPEAGLSPAAMERALQVLDAEDEQPAYLAAELLGSHPLMIRRIEQLRDFASSESYRRMQALVDRNLS